MQVALKGATVPELKPIALAALKEMNAGVPLADVKELINVMKAPLAEEIASRTTAEEIAS